MKGLSLKAKVYLFTIYICGTVVLLWNLLRLDRSHLFILFVLALLASLATVFKVEGTTSRSHYAINFLLYGFTFFYLGAPEAMLVILVSNLALWIFRKLLWYISIFNITSFILVLQVSDWIYQWINPSGNLNIGMGALGIALSMLVFTLLNHLTIGLVVWLARNENFTQSGIFDILPLMIDLTLLLIGGSLVLVWNYNPYAILLFLIPLYLIYSSLRMPALERQTELDAKTGIYNNRYFEQQLENELSRANRFDRPLTIIMSDLDLLRNINNTYGHLAGDEVLIGVAKILKQSVREYDIVSRFGGEEFAVLLPETSVVQAYERAEALRRAIEKAEFTIPTSVTPIKATMSFGVAGREGFNQTGKEIIHNADIALYHSKLKGRNRTYAYTEEAYDSFFAVQVVESSETAEVKEDMKSPQESEYTADQTRFQASQVNVGASSGKDQTLQMKGESTHATASTAGSKRLVDLYIILSALIAAGLFTLVFRSFPSINQVDYWLGLITFTIIVILTEWFSIDLYVHDTAVSTSAAPMLAGVLLFGPFGALTLSFAFALTAYLKHRGPFNRLIFNASNQLVAAMLYTGVLVLTHQAYLNWPPIAQILFCMVSAVVVYLCTTVLIALGMSLSARMPFQQVWKEQFSWLAPHYLTMGLIAYALIFGYSVLNILGTFIILTPLILLRFSQKLYIDRTRAVVSELRDKNVSLEKSAEEIESLNEGLLEMLAEVIDLRDPYVLGHSRNVTDYAIYIAKELGLNPKQIELIRKAGLLHDVGKLGVPEYLLSKPTKLTKEEFDMMKRHVTMGATLLQKSPSLRPLIPIVKHHHEYYDGKGYPDGLKGNQIPIEARIIAVADAIEAMNSDRSYRKAFDVNQIILELRKSAGAQFDPQVVDVSVKILKLGKGVRVSEAFTKVNRMVPGQSGLQNQT